MAWSSDSSVLKAPFQFEKKSYGQGVDEEGCLSLLKTSTGKAEERKDPVDVLTKILLAKLFLGEQQLFIKLMKFKVYLSVYFAIN